MNNRLIGLVLAALLAPVLFGCEESVDPVLGTGRPFTLYGFLDPGSDRQALRIYQIEDILVPTGQDRIDAEMRSRLVSGGPWVAWSDSIVAFRQFLDENNPSTIWGTVLWADFRAEFDADYELEVSRSDGNTTTVIARTPSRSVVEVGPATGIRENMVLPVIYKGAARLLKPSVEYVVATRGEPEPWRVRVPYSAGVVELSDGLLFTVQLSRDIGFIYTATGLQPGVDEIWLRGVTIRAFLAEASWYPPNGNYDPEILVEPGTFSNVTNGFGFVGGGYVDESVWEIDQVAAELAGFDIPPNGRNGIPNGS